MKMVIKIYAGVGNGETFWKAMWKGHERGTPPEIETWIENYQEGYMGTDYDQDRISTIVWDLQNMHLMNFFHRIKVDLDSQVWHITNNNKTLKNWLKNIAHETDNKSIFIERSILKLWLEMAKNEDEVEALKQLIKAFNDDLENDRIGWAYERSSEAFNDFFDDIDADDDEQVADFFGIKLEIEGIEIDGEEYSLSEVEFCIHCKEPTVFNDMKNSYDADDFDEGMFYCSECGDYYPYDEEHCKINKHIPEHIIIARRV